MSWNKRANPAMAAALAAILATTTQPVMAQATATAGTSATDAETSADPEARMAEPSAWVLRTSFIARNFEDMFALYVDLLGYELVFRTVYKGSGTFYALFNVDPSVEFEYAVLKPGKGEGARLGVLVLPEGEARGVEVTPYRPTYGEAIIVAETDDLPALYERILAADPKIVTIIAHPFDTTGGREMVIADANGTRIYLFQRDPS